MGQSMSILNPIDEIFLQPSRNEGRARARARSGLCLRSRLRALFSLLKDGRRHNELDHHTQSDDQDNNNNNNNNSNDSNDYGSGRYNPFGSNYEEDLARAVQESMDLEDSRRNKSTSSSSSSTPNKQRYICAGCNQEIGPGRFLSCLGSVWHPQCFRCKACGNPISGSQFALSGSDKFHKECYRDLYHPKCEVCYQFIPPNSSGLIEYRAHPFWGQKYCPVHEKDGSPRCCSCERVEARDRRYVSLDDGRKLCLECLDSAVMDTHECQPLYHEILDFYEGMNMKISQAIPMLLVERQALNEAREHERDGYHHLPETRGLCLSEEQTVSTVYRKPKAPRSSNPMAGMRTESFKLRRQCEVTAILVLYGLPRLLTGSILAHELMHAWLRLNGYPHHLNPSVEEGICQVMAHTWLESQIGSGSSSAGKQKPKSINNDRFQEFFLHQIAMDSSPAYGDGFRAGHQSVVQFGLTRTLEHIKLTGSFPV